MKEKSIMYKKEQECIINEIVNLLKLEENNFQLVLCKLENNKELHKVLMSYIPKIRKYFSFDHIRSVSQPEKYKRPWLGIIE